MLTNKVIWEGFQALNRLGELELPKEAIRPIGFKLALVRNSLQPLAKALEDTRQSLVKAHRLTNVDLAKEEKGSSADERLEAFRAEWEVLMAEDSKWESPAKVEASKFDVVNQLRANDLAALVTLGIVTDADKA